MNISFSAFKELQLETCDDTCQNIILNRFGKYDHVAKQFEKFFDQENMADLLD